MKQLYVVMMLNSLAYGACYQGPRYYNDQEITPNTLYNLMQEASPIPVSVHQQVSQWLHQDDNVSLLKQLLEYNVTNFAVGDPGYYLCGAKMEQDIQLMKQHGLHNKSRSNYVFTVPEVNYNIKIAGPDARCAAILSEQDLLGKRVAIDTCREVLASNKPTHRTALHAAFFLIIKESCQKYKKKSVHLLPTHMLYCPEAQENVCDGSIFILEEELPAQARRLTHEIKKDLSDFMITELIDIIMRTGLHDIERTVFLDPHDNVLHIGNFLEQTNHYATSKDFFYKNDDRVKANIITGLRQMLELFADDDQKLLLIRQCIELHPMVISNVDYKNDLVNWLNRRKVPAN